MKIDFILCWKGYFAKGESTLIGAVSFVAFAFCSLISRRKSFWVNFFLAANLNVADMIAKFLNLKY